MNLSPFLEIVREILRNILKRFLCKHGKNVLHPFPFLFGAGICHFKHFSLDKIVKQKPSSQLFYMKTISEAVSTTCKHRSAVVLIFGFFVGVDVKTVKNKV